MPMDTPTTKVDKTSRRQEVASRSFSDLMFIFDARIMKRHIITEHTIPTLDSYRKSNILPKLKEKSSGRKKEQKGILYLDPSISTRTPIHPSFAHASLTSYTAHRSTNSSPHKKCISMQLNHHDHDVMDTSSTR